MSSVFCLMASSVNYSVLGLPGVGITKFELFPVKNFRITVFTTEPEGSIGLIPLSFSEY